jgi:hypothetical protein
MKQLGGFKRKKPLSTPHSLLQSTPHFLSPQRKKLYRRNKPQKPKNRQKK